MLLERFDHQDWYTQLAALMAPDLDKNALLDGLRQLMYRVCDIDNYVVFVFDRDNVPLVVDFRVSSGDLNNYQSGPYLLDPFYHAWIEERPGGLFRLRDLAPDRFTHSEYYQSYYKRTDYLDEMGYLLPMNERHCMHLTIGRSKSFTSFSARDIKALRLIAPVVETIGRRIYDMIYAGEALQDGSNDGPSRNTQLRDAFILFGSSILTDRECEITRQLLRGHSAKSSARELGISPGTVRIHRKNIYGKLLVSSQTELFSLFIDALDRVTEKTVAVDPLTLLDREFGPL